MQGQVRPPSRGNPAPSRPPSQQGGIWGPRPHAGQGLRVRAPDPARLLTQSGQAGPGRPGRGDSPALDAGGRESAQRVLSSGPSPCVPGRLSPLESWCQWTRPLLRSREAPLRPGWPHLRLAGPSRAALDWPRLSGVPLPQWPPGEAPRRQFCFYSLSASHRCDQDAQPEQRSRGRLRAQVPWPGLRGSGPRRAGASWRGGVGRGLTAGAAGRRERQEPGQRGTPQARPQASSSSHGHQPGHSSQHLVPSFRTPQSKP